MKINKITRRLFLQGIGGATVALPLLESLLPSTAFGATAAPAKRYIAIRSLNGQRLMYWKPSPPAGSTTKAMAHVRTTPLSAYTTGINKILDNSFAPLYSKMNFLEGLDIIPALGHNIGGLIGNFNDQTDTIDQVLAYSNKVYPQDPSIRSLLVGHNCASTGSFSYKNSNGYLIQLPAYLNLQAAFDRVFFSATAAKTAHHIRVVDAVFADYQNLKSNSRLSALDRQALDRHLTFVGELQSRLRNATPLACPSSPSRPTMAQPSYSPSLADIENYYQTMNSLIALSIMCGATRVATLNIGYPKTYGGGDWHGPSHNAEAEPNPVLLEINQWIAKKIVMDLVQKLNVPESGGSTYLDNSLVHWGNEISVGWSHRNESMPTVTFGSLGGKIKTGQHISYLNDGNILVPTGEIYFGRPYNQFLVSILQGMGLSPADYETTGKKSYGAISSLDAERMRYYNQFMTDIGNPLPAYFIG